MYYFEKLRNNPKATHTDGKMSSVYALNEVDRDSDLDTNNTEKFTQRPLASQGKMSGHYALNSIDREDFQNNKEYDIEIDLIKKADSNVNLGALKKVNDTDKKRDILWSFLINKFKKNSDKLDLNLKQLKALDSNMQKQRESAKSKRDKYRSIKHNNDTIRRKIQIHNNNYLKIKDQHEVLKRALLIVAVLFVLPLLKIFNILPGRLLLILWGVVIGALAIHTIWELYFVKGDISRSTRDYNKLKFYNPDPESILVSRLGNKLSDEEKLKCKTLDELHRDFDPLTLAIPDEVMNKWYSKDVQKCK